MGPGAGVLAALALVAGPPDGQGANLTAFTANAYRTPAATRSLDDLRATGLDRAAVVTTWYMDDARSSEIAPDPAETPTDASIVQLAAEARQRGISVVIKPHVDVRDGTFRGQIEPLDRAAWWESYRRMIEHYANLARSVDADGLVVGTELGSMSSDTIAFEQLILQTRERFSGTLLYAANWDEVNRVAFWPALDAIGVDAYYPLADAPGASVEQLAAAWEPIADDLERLSRRVGRPVVFTELGYPARPHAAVNPSGAYRTLGPVDEEAQARAYTATLEAFSDEPWLRGIYWWDWPIDDRDVIGAAYSPRDRPAEQVIRSSVTGEDDGSNGVSAALAAVPWPLFVVIGIWVAVAVGFLAVIRAAGRADDDTGGLSPAVAGPAPPPPFPEPLSMPALTVVPEPEPEPDPEPEPEPEERPEAAAEPETDPEPEPEPATPAPAAIASTPPRPAGRFEHTSPRADPMRDIGPLDLDHLSAIIAQVMAVDMVAILVRAPDDPHTLIAAGEHGVSLRGRRWPADAGLAGMVLARGERVVVSDYAELDRRLGGEQVHDVHPAAAAPLVTRTGLRGGVSIGSRNPARRIEVSDLELLSVLTELVASGMDNPPETEWPDEGARAQVEGLVSAMDARDSDERRRMAMLVAMADRVGARMLEGDVRARGELTLAARLHDVGMLRVPVAPLKRPGPLVGGVERLITSHPAWGADLIAAIPGMQAVAAYVRFHQERWDGAGYPHGLAGERIPLQSRIVAVCEAWASMVIGRPHAPARTPEHAVEELRRGAGSQFDPAVVEVVVGVSRTMPRPMPRVASE